MLGRRIRSQLIHQPGSNSLDSELPEPTIVVEPLARFAPKAVLMVVPVPMVMLMPVLEPMLKARLEVKLKVKPLAEPVVEPVVKPVVEPVAEPMVEPVVEHRFELVLQALAEVVRRRPITTITVIMTLVAFPVSLVKHR